MFDKSKQYATITDKLTKKCYILQGGVKYNLRGEPLEAVKEEPVKEPVSDLVKKYKTESAAKAAITRTEAWSLATHEVTVYEDGFTVSEV